MEIGYSPSFKRMFKKKIKGRRELEKKFWECVQNFINDPFARSLRTHKLSGGLKELWSFSVEYDVRIIFYFVENGKKAIFVNIGTHDEVY